MWGRVSVVAGEACGGPLVGRTSWLLWVLEIMARCLSVMELVHCLGCVGVAMSRQAGCSIVVSWHGRYTSEGATLSWFIWLVE